MRARACGASGVTVLLVALLAACASRDESQRNGVDTTTPPVGAAAPMVVTASGIGPVRAGLTAAIVRKMLLRFELTPVARQGGCDYAVTDGLPVGVKVMVVSGRVARVEVDSTGVPTAEGAQVGDSEGRVKSLYGARVAVSSHKYTKGHYLTVTPAAVSDSVYRIVFETDGQRVLRYRVGRQPEVGWVEGCS